MRLSDIKRRACLSDTLGDAPLHVRVLRCQKWDRLAGSIRGPFSEAEVNSSYVHGEYITAKETIAALLSA